LFLYRFKEKLDEREGLEGGGGKDLHIGVGWGGGEKRESLFCGRKRRISTAFLTSMRKQKEHRNPSTGKVVSGDPMSLPAKGRAMISSRKLAKRSAIEMRKKGYDGNGASSRTAVKKKSEAVVWGEALVIVGEGGGGKSCRAGHKRKEKARTGGAFSPSLFRSR